MDVQATDKKYLIHESQIEQASTEERPPLHLNEYLWFWSDHFVLIEGVHDDNYWNFHVYNLFMDNSQPIRFHTSGEQFDEIQVFPLQNNFGFIVEFSDDVKRISFVELNWSLSKFQVIEQFERHCFYVIIMFQLLNCLEFIIGCYNDTFDANSYQFCKISNKGIIEFGEIIQSNKFYNGYFGNKLFGHRREENQFKIRTFDMIEKKESVVTIEELPDGVEDGLNMMEWICNRIYLAVRFQDSNNSGIAWTDANTRNWTMINFETNFPIIRFDFLGAEWHVFATEFSDVDGVYKSSQKFYSIQMRRPRLLRNSAWLMIIGKMKRDGIEDPYNEAVKYLPFNADTRSPWIEDTKSNENEANTKQGLDGMNQGDGDKLSGPNGQQSESDMDQESSDEIPSKRFKSS